VQREKLFVAGTDLKERSTLDAEGKWNQARLLYEAGKALENAPQVVVDVLEKYVLGGKLTVAISSDLGLHPLMQSSDFRKWPWRPSLGPALRPDWHR